MRKFGGKVKLSVENYGDSELARRFGVTRYPAIFVEDILVAKPKDFGFYGKGEGSGEGRYTPWKDAKSHERFRQDLTRMIEAALAGNAQGVRQSERRKEDTAEELSALPALALSDLSGKTVAVDDLKGRVVLVEFWATWCPPCRGTLAWLGELKQKYGNRLVVLAIAIESDEKDVREIASEQSKALRWIIGSPEVARNFGDVSAVPTLFVFDSTGKTVEIYYGAPPDLHTNAEQKIEAILNQ